MAGTRLWVQGTVLLALLLLTALAAYLGLCKTSDEVCLALVAHVAPFLGGSARDLFARQSEEWLAQWRILLLPLPTLHVAVASNNDMESWKLALQDAFKRSHRLVDTGWIEFNDFDESDAHIKEVCDPALDDGTSSQNRLVTPYSLWICAPSTVSHGGGQSKIIHRPGATIIHPSNKVVDVSLVAQALSRLDPQASSKRHKLTVSLMIEANLDWTPWGTAISRWVQQETPVLTDEYPCLIDRATTTNLLFASGSNNLSQHAMERSRNDSDNSTTTTTTTTTYWVTNTANVTKALDDLSSDLNVVLYVPTQVPLYIVDENDRSQQGRNSAASAAMMAKNRVVGMANHQPLLDDHYYMDHNSIVNDALKEIVHPFLRENCMGWTPLPSPRLPTLLQMDDEHWIPEYAMVLYLREVLVATHDRVLDGLSRQRALLLSLATTLDLTVPMERWWQVVQLVQDANTLAGKNEWMTSLEFLEQAENTLVALRSDPLLLEPFDFAMDHYLAVFAPLLFPLLLPFFGGLLREIKRYRDKKKKSKVL